MSESLVIRNKLDVTNFIDTQPGRRKAYLLVALIALGGTFIDGYDFTSLGIGTVQLTTVFHLSPFTLGFVTASMAIGAVAGAVVGGYFVDRLGRLHMFVLDMALFVLSAIGAALAPNYSVLILFRILMGIGVGLDYPVALSYIAEFVRMRKRTGWLTSWVLNWQVAATLGFAIMIPIWLTGVGNDLWRIAVGIGALPAIVLLLLRLRYMSESPVWAAANGELDRAAAIISREYGVQCSSETPKTTAGVHPENELPRFQISPRAILALLSGRFRGRTLYSMVVGFVQSIEYFALAFYFPKIAAIIVGKHITELLVASSLFNLAGAIGGIAAVLLVVKYGTRRLTQVGFLVVGGMLLIMGLLGPSGMPAILGACMLIFIAFHIMGPGGMTMVVGTMSYPAEVRATGAGLTEAAVRCGSVVGFFVFPILLASVGLANTVLILLACPMVGILATLVFRWEMLGYDADASVNIAEDLGGGATQPVK